MEAWEKKYLNQIVNIDCREGMKELPDGCVDLVLTDPPFNSEKKMGSSFRPGSKNKINPLEWFIYDNMSGRAYSNWFSIRLKELYRITKSGCHIYIFSNWRSLRNIMDLLEMNFFSINDLIVWDKNQFGIGFYYRPQIEFIIFASKNKPRKLNNQNTSNIFRIKRVSNKDMNTLVQKPVELIEKIINITSSQLDLILDPFMGSGTTAIAAIRTGRNFIGMEISQAYVEIANKRIGYERQQLKLEL